MTDSCLALAVPRFFGVFKWMLPIYGALHFIPMILFKRKLFVKDPVRMLTKAGWGTTRSSAFLGAFVVVYQGQSLLLSSSGVTLHLISRHRFFLFQAQSALVTVRSEGLITFQAAPVCCRCANLQVVILVWRSPFGSCPLYRGTPSP